MENKKMKSNHEIIKAVNLTHYYDDVEETDEIKYSLEGLNITINEG
jgi:hypothetical protein